MSVKEETGRGLSFVKRVYPARALGLGLGALAVGAALLPQQHPLFFWALWAVNGFIWPHLAYFKALRSQAPFQTERKHLLFDSTSGGFWVAAMGFNPLASSMIIMMLWMNNIAAGGVRLFLKGVVGSVAGLALGLLVFGWQLNLVSGQLIVFACLPMLVAYPVAIGSITYRLAIQLHKQKELLKQISRVDGLTGLYNRHYWETRVSDLMAMVRRSAQPLSLILLDVDHFKSINDTHGHLTGDQVLQQIARLLRLNLRESELLGRYGGEEFALVLPNTDKEAAYATAERLRRLVQLAHFDTDKGATGLSCTISLGVASYHAGFQSYSDWFRAADQALYAAKEEGRNKTVLSCSGLYKADIATA
ncbi:diguanylate cyclase [Cellvibrio mixtus]|uniref:diguanylate cyclase n=1 Tax=Cellvibrio mixtus TaxID=39650 RepID=UPI000587469E|nr:diguanylate cyclase [Cellvibrio mixtus]